MVRTIIKFYTNINYRITCQNTALHSSLDTCVNCRDIFLRNRTADNLIVEFIALTYAVFVEVREHTNLTVTVLTATTGLLLILCIGHRVLSDCFFVCNLRCTDICLYLKFTEQTVNDDFKVKFTHTCDDGLSCFFIGISLKCRIFFCKFCKSNTHLFLTCLSLWLDSYTNYRVREIH